MKNSNLWIGLQLSLLLLFPLGARAGGTDPIDPVAKKAAALADLQLCVFDEARLSSLDAILQQLGTRESFSKAWGCHAALQRAQELGVSRAEIVQAFEQRQAQSDPQGLRQASARAATETDKELPEGVSPRDPLAEAVRQAAAKADRAFGRSAR